MATSYFSIKNVELMAPVTGTVYCKLQSGVASERTQNLPGLDNSAGFIFQELVTLEMQSTHVNVGVYLVTGGFTDKLLGECAFNVEEPEPDDRYPLYLYNRKENLKEVSGTIFVRLESTALSHKLGGARSASQDLLSSLEPEQLRKSNIAEKSSKSITKMINELVHEKSEAADLSGLSLDRCPAELALIAPFTKTLDFGFNKFSQFPDVSLLKFEFLEEFTLTGNQLTEIPPEVSRLVNLTSFNLNGNQLRQLPVELGKLVLLEKLDLSNNLLDRLMPEIGYLTKLSDLHLSGNPIGQLPRSIGRCVEMEVMDLSNCQLKALPNEFTRLTKLMELNLGNNELSQLPSNVGRMSRLVVLNLADNHLGDLPLSIGYCQGLLQCYLEGNPISDPKLFQASKNGPDHLCDYLETRMLSYMADRGINPQRLQEQMEAQEQEEKNKKIRQQQQEEAEVEARRQAEEERRRQEEVEAKQRMIANATPQEQAIFAKLNQARNMGCAIFSDCLNRIAHLEMFTGQVTSIRQGLPFARAVDGLVPDMESLQRIIGYQREPAVPRVGVGFASPQLQNFKHGILIKLAHANVCVGAAIPFLQDADDAQTIVNIVKIARAMNFKLTNIM